MNTRRNMLVLLGFTLYLAAHWPRPERWPYLLPSGQDHGIIEELPFPADMSHVTFIGRVHSIPILRSF